MSRLRFLSAALALAALVPPFAGLAAAPVPPANVRVYRDAPYAVVRSAGKALPLDLYVPEGAGRGPRPVVIWLHGGGWKSGDKSLGAPVEIFTRAGYALASVNYRLSSQGRFPAQIQDCKAAVRFLRARAKELGLDPARIGVCGISSGGHLAALLGTSGGVAELEDPGEGNAGVSSRVQAVVDLCGPTDLVALDRRGNDGPITGLLGGPASQRRELARLANPGTFASADDPPFLILHGEADRTVPPEQSRLLAEALRRAGARVTLALVPDADHTFKGRWPFVAARVTEFFDQHLKR